MASAGAPARRKNRGRSRPYRFPNDEDEERREAACRIHEHLPAVGVALVAEAFWVAEIARKMRGHNVRVVPSMLAPSLGVGQRRLKSDQRNRA